MDTILILGGYGATGQLLARHLLRETDARLILTGRNLHKAQALAGELNAIHPGERVSARQLDAADPAGLAQAFRGVRLVLVAAPTTAHTDAVARAALQAGADYLDVQFADTKLAALRALEPQIRAAGRCFVTEAGFHPGLPSALVRFAAGRMDQLESAVTAGYLNVGDTMPYTEAVDELVEAFRNYQAQVFKNGAWTKPGSYEMRKFDFGPQVGARLCYSMFFEELRGLPDMYPNLRETGFYISSTNLWIDLLMTPIIMIGLKIAPKRSTRPLGRLLWWSMTGATRPPYQVILKVEASGRRAGQPVRLQAAISHPDGYELTAIPVVAFLKQYLDGSARRPGLWMMGHLADPARLFADMQRMGANLQIREN